MGEILRGGVIGAGVFGGFHARQYAQADGARLAGVFDPHPERAQALVDAHGGQAFTDFEAFLRAVDVVTVASPAQFHAPQGLAALAAGKPIYVEKPLAIRMDDARALIAASQARDLVIACGHQERVVFQVIGLFDIPEPPLRLEATRHVTQSERSLDVSVVLDLMIHDLDLALAVSAAQPVSIQAQGAEIFSGGWDRARAEIGFDDGFTCVFDVLRGAGERMRTMKIVYPSGEVEIDFLTRAFRNTTGFELNADFADTPAVKDTLATCIAAFLAAVRGEAPRPVVSAPEAARALDLALRIEHALEAQV